MYICCDLCVAVGNGFVNESTTVKKTYGGSSADRQMVGELRARRHFGSTRKTYVCACVRAMYTFLTVLG